jgi:hypothetical protein
MSIKLLEKHEDAMYSELAELCMSEIVFSLKRNSINKPLEHQWEMPCRHLLQTSSWGFLRKS